MRRSSPSGRRPRRTGRARRRRWSVPRAGEEPDGVVAAEQRRSEVDHVAVDQTRPRGTPRPRRRRPRRAPAGARGPELVEDRRRGRRFVSRHGCTCAPAGAAPSTTRSGSRRRGAGGVAHGERWVVGPDRAGADEDGVALGPQPVGVGAGGRTGDPLARAVGGGGAAVEGGGQLQHDVRPAGAAVDEVGRQEPPGLIRTDPDLDDDAGGAQAPCSGAGDPSVRVQRARRRPGPRRPRRGRLRRVPSARGGCRARGSPTPLPRRATPPQPAPHRGRRPRRGDRPPPRWPLRSTGRRASRARSRPRGSAA